jgi:hypothetical protein
MFDLKTELETMSLIELKHIEEDVTDRIANRLEGLKFETDDYKPTEKDESDNRILLDEIETMRDFAYILGQVYRSKLRRLYRGHSDQFWTKKTTLNFKEVK